MSKSTASKKKSNGLLMGGIAAIIAAAVMLGGGLYFIIRDDNSDAPTPGSVVAVGEEDTATACQNLLSSYYTAMISKDGAAMYQLMAPPEYWAYYQQSYDKTEAEIIATYRDAASNTLAEWEAACGSQIKVSFHIEGSSQQTDAFLTEWSDTMNEMIGSESLHAEEALTLEVTQTVTGSAGTKETTLHPTLIQVNDQWYILDEGANTETTAQ